MFHTFRVVRHESQHSESYRIHEVHIDPSTGELLSVAVNPSAPGGTDLESLRADLESMLRALSKDVIEAAVAIVSDDAAVMGDQETEADGYEPVEMVGVPTPSQRVENTPQCYELVLYRPPLT